MISLDTTSLVKVLMAALLAVVVWVGLAYRPVLAGGLARQPAVLVTWLSFVGLRLIPFVGVYLVLNQAPRSDVAFFYIKAEAALKGGLVYRDFLSFHAPLFGYFISLPLLLWHNSKVLILLMAAMEFLVATGTLRYYRPRQPDATLRFVLYYLLPLPFIAMILSSEEDLWMWGFGLLTLALPLTNRRFSLWAGVVWGLGMLTIKFMLIVFLIPVFFIVPNRLQYVAGLLLVGVPSVLLLYYLMGLAFLMPIQHSSLEMIPNLLSVLRPMVGSVVTRIPLTYLNWAGLLLTIGGASYTGHRFRALGYARLLPLLYVFTFTLFMIALPSSPGYYLFAYALPMAFLLPATDRGAWLAFIALNLLTVIEPILYIVYGGHVLYNTWSIIDSPARWADYVVQWAEVGLLIRLLWWCWQQMQTQLAGSVPTPRPVIA